MAKKRKWSDYEYKFFKSFAGGVPDWSSQAAQDYGLEKFGSRNAFSATGDACRKRRTRHTSLLSKYRLQESECFWKKKLYPPPPRTTKLWGYTGFTMSVCPSVRPSVCPSVCKMSVCPASRVHSVAPWLFDGISSYVAQIHPIRGWCVAYHC